MTLHNIDAGPPTCHPSFSPRHAPVITVEPGDDVEIRNIPDVSWGIEAPASPTSPRRRLDGADPSGPCLCGPIGVRGARAGATLAIAIESVETGQWGYTWAGGRDWPDAALFERLAVADQSPALLRWRIDAPAGACINQHGHRVPLAPFHGCIGLAHAPGAMPPPNPWHPRRTGGNIDCRHLTAGSTLLLPIECDGALLYLGDTHAAQGDGELSGMAIECMATRTRLRLSLSKRPLAGPAALTPDGLVVLGFGEGLDAAIAEAVRGLLDLIGPALGLERAEALGMASVSAHMHVTQLVNGVVGAHALLPARFAEANGIDLPESLGLRGG